MLASLKITNKTKCFNMLKHFVRNKTWKEVSIKNKLSVGKLSQANPATE